MNRSLSLAVCAGLCFGLSFAIGPVARAEDAKEVKPDTRPHTDEQVAPALAEFETEFAAKDIETRINAVRKIGRWRHKKVLKELTQILERNPDLELKAAAALALGNQTPFAKVAAKTLGKNLEAWDTWGSRKDPVGDDKVQNEDEVRVLSNGILAIGDLGSKDVWEQIEIFIDHPHDGPAAAMMKTIGKTKEWRALPKLLEWFNFYPDGLSWSGGSAEYDSASAANGDQERDRGQPSDGGDGDAAAAKAKYQAKYGGRSKKARPNVFLLMVQAVKDITGVEFSKPEELKLWMKENKALLKKHGV